MITPQKKWAITKRGFESARNKAPLSHSEAFSRVLSSMTLRA